MHHLSLPRRDFLRRTAAAGVATWLVPRAARAAKPANEKIKVGQIGTGHSHATKLEVYRESPDYEVVGIVEPDPALRAAAERQAAYRDLPWLSEEQLLNTPGPQAVLVETRVRDLLDTAERVVAAGKHVHLDKPAGSSLRQYRRLLDVAARQNLLVQMGYMYRYNPGFLLLRRFLNEGWLGEVYEVHGTMSKVLPPDDRLRVAEYSGGIMFELGCHIIDQLVSTLGKPQRVESIARHSAPSDDTLADNVLAVCEYPKAIATIKASAQEVDGGGRRHFVVCGTLGTVQVLRLDGPSVRYTLDRDRGEFKKGTHDVSFEPYRRYVGDAADMARVIRGEKSSDYSYAHDFDMQETVLRAAGMSLDA
ncbi:MAG TPA: Gfo/Idh/MocA family oxidoreductase [Pirellulales bacterium]|jgi:predicted dehydrogenase|nr:Gfo/Idh/MocA family oxidoreductase [Pirellulales bacterium]